MTFKSLILSVAIWGAVVAPTVAAETDANRAKPFPEVTFDRVNAIFGDNLDASDPRLKTLLLAIGMDHTSTSSPHKREQVGVPFIVHYGAHYWVNRLAAGDASIDVLVNNALLLLFAETEIPGREEAAYSLMTAAAGSGYWPADYFIAETDLQNHLVRDPVNIVPLSNEIDRSHLQEVAQKTMAAYNRCAELGFAPCRYRIGFWLSNSQPTLVDGLTVLQNAVNTTLRDTRYQGVLDAELVSATTALVEHGHLIGLTADMRQQYDQLLKSVLK